MESNDKSISPSVINSDLIRSFNNCDEYFSIRARFVNISGGESEVRRNWLKGVFVAYSEYDFSVRPEIITSTAQSDYDVIIFGGEDTRRLSTFMKEQSSLMFNKIKICLCLKSGPRRRARLIMAGFDDVIDITRVQHLEFVARLFSIWSRYRQSTAFRRLDVERESMLSKVAHPDQLTPKQKAVLSHLLSSPDLSARYDSLRIAASRGHEIINIGNLKVIISETRKALKSGCSIISDGSSVYKLIVNKEFYGPH